MKTVVFIKQVPDTDNVSWTKDNNIDRSDTDSVMNFCDKQALEFAKNLRKKFGGEIITVTMGPVKALETAKEAVALGADKSVLLSDSKFTGSDTIATSEILSQFIKAKNEDADLLIFGKSAADGETSQTGPMVAADLNMPFLTRVKEVSEIENEKVLTVTTDDGEYKKVYKISLPCVLCVDNENIIPEIPEVEGYIKAKDNPPEIFNAYEINADLNKTGIKGSPTYVKAVFKSKDMRNCRYINPDEDNFEDKIISETADLTES